jgi:hypothetical protein
MEERNEVKCKERLDKEKENENDKPTGRKRHDDAIDREWLEHCEKLLYG